MKKPKVLITLPKETLEKLDKYAEENYMGSRSMAVYCILKKHFDSEEKPS